MPPLCLYLLGRIQTSQGQITQDSSHANRQARKEIQANIYPQTVSSINIIRFLIQSMEISKTGKTSCTDKYTSIYGEVGNQIRFHFLLYLFLIKDCVSSTQGPLTTYMLEPHIRPAKLQWVVEWLMNLKKLPS